MLQVKEIIGISSGVLAFSAFIPYFIAILQGKTTPNRATWVIWAFVSAISVLSYKASGANYTIWYPVSDTIAPSIVLILSIKMGEGGWTKLDRLCLATAIFAII